MAQRNWKGDGLRIKLTRIPGVTPKGILRKTYRFQVPPLEEFSRAHSFNHATYETISKGQFQRRGGRQLIVIGFQTLGVEYASWAVTREAYGPKRQGDELQKIHDKGYPFLLQVSHRFPRVEFEMEATMVSLTISERAGEPDTRYYNIDFMEYRDPKVRRKRQGKNWPKKHKLDANDTLYKLARKYYGKPSLAGRIGRRNKFLAHWGKRTPIIRHKHYKKGDKILVPHPPKAKNATTHSATVSREDALDARDDAVEELDGIEV